MNEMFDLQRFAAEVQTTTLEGLAPEMKTFYDKQLIEEAKANLVHGQFGQKRPIPKNGGKTIEFRKFDPLPKASTPLTEGVTPDGKSLNVTSISSTVEQYGDYVTISDMLDLTAIDPVVAETLKLLSTQSGLTIDTVDRNALQSGTNVSYCPNVAADGTQTEVLSRAALTVNAELTPDMVNRVVAKLRAQNAPTINGKYIAIIHPYVAYDLMKHKDWINAHAYASAENIYAGEIGEYGGVRFVQTTEAKIYTGTGCPNGLAVFTTLFLGANAYGTTEIEGGGLEAIVKQKGSAGTADPLDQRSSVGWKAAHAAELLIPNYIVRVESCSKAFSATAKAN